MQEIVDDAINDIAIADYSTDDTDDGNSFVPPSISDAFNAISIIKKFLMFNNHSSKIKQNILDIEKEMENIFVNKTLKKQNSTIVSFCKFLLHMYVSAYNVVRL